MKKIAIHITPHDVELSPSLLRYIERKISTVTRVARDILAAEIILRGREGAAHLFSVGARVALPGSDLQGHATHPSLYGAIDQLASRLARLARKRKTRLIRASRRPSKKQTMGLPVTGPVFSS